MKKRPSVYENQFRSNFGQFKRAAKRSGQKYHIIAFEVPEELRKVRSGYDTYGEANAVYEIFLKFEHGYVGLWQVADGICSRLCFSENC